MYEMAFKMRADRHEMERSQSEALKLIEVKKDEVKEAQKKMKYHENVYTLENEKLLEFRVSSTANPKFSAKFYSNSFLFSVNVNRN